MGTRWGIDANVVESAKTKHHFRKMDWWRQVHNPSPTLTSFLSSISINCYCTTFFQNTFPIVSFTMELFSAAKDGHEERVQALIKQGAALNTASDWGVTALSTAAEHGHLDVIRCLVEAGANIEKADFFRRTPLRIAVACGQVEVTRYLLEQGADSTTIDGEGWTLLHYAALFGHLKIVKLLISAGADVTEKAKGGETPIDVAANEDISHTLRDKLRCHVRLSRKAIDMRSI